MKVLVKKYNSERIVIRIDVYHCATVIFHPAGLIELLGGRLEHPLYIKTFAKDPLNITIEDYIEEPNANQSKLQ